MPKTGNTDTLIRTLKSPDVNQVLIPPTENHNFTTKNKITNLNDDTVSSEDFSLLGDTLQAVEIDNVNNTFGNINLNIETKSIKHAELK